MPNKELKGCLICKKCCRMVEIFTPCLGSRELTRRHCSRQDHSGYVTHSICRGTRYDVNWHNDDRDMSSLD